MIEDRPWFIRPLMIAMAQVFLSGSQALIGSGALFIGLMMGLVGTGVPLR